MSRQQIPAFVVNLDRRSDRRDYMRDQLAALGMSWERVPAIDAATAPDAALAADVDLDRQTIAMGRGSQACAATMLALFRQIAAGEGPGALVLQDDVELSPEVPRFLEDARWVPDGIGIVQFEKWSRRPSSKLLGPPIGRPPVRGRSIRRLHSRTAGAAAFFVTRAAAAALGHEAGRLRYPIDHLLFNPNVSRLAREQGVAMVVPALARQVWGALGSDLVAARAAREKRLHERLRRGWYEVCRLPEQLAAVAFSGARMVPVAFEERTAPEACPA